MKEMNIEDLKSVRGGGSSPADYVLSALNPVGWLAADAVTSGKK